MNKERIYNDLIIIEKYEKFLNYMYPIAQNIPRKHGIAKEMFIHSLLEQVKLFSIAGKSNQISKLYICDAGYSKFFPSIDRQKLHLLIERKIKCKETLWLLQQIIPNTGNGIPIGSLTSQLFANVYGGIIDHYLHYALKVKHWARYMDDIVIFGKTLEELKIIKQKIVNYSLQEMNMSLSKYTINSLQKGINFLGYRIWRTHKLIRKSSVIRAKRKIKKYIINKDTEQLNLFLAAWLGHIKWANCYNLINHLGDYYETYYQY